jgi:glyoxylase-like metal-dependent hydrolase (beta-lactamase superfamily II)
LDQLPSKPKLILTHHHHDHVEGLSTVLARFPGAEVLAQQNTFKRLRPGTIPEGFDLRKHCLSGKEETIHVGSTEVRLIFLPGHTDGHIVLWLPQSRCLLAGDHIVGFGSAVLDPDGGGNMKQYLDSTRQLADLDPILAIPAHGHPVLTGAQKLLERYIAHRMIRHGSKKRKLRSSFFVVSDRSHRAESKKFSAHGTQEIVH